MAKSIKKHRALAFIKQGGLCIYCACPMWQDSPEEFAKRYGITVSQAMHHRCTAEHKIARQDGGTDCAENILAACHRCNQGRHKRKYPLTIEEFIRLVRQRLQLGRWHIVVFQ